MFGPCVSKNGYWYCFSDNVDIIKSVEEMWMITHQRTQIPNIQLINKPEAMGLFMRGMERMWIEHFLVNGKVDINFIGYMHLQQVKVVQRLCWN